MLVVAADGAAGEMIAESAALRIALLGDRWRWMEDEWRSRSCMKTIPKLAPGSHENLLSGAVCVVQMGASLGISTVAVDKSVSKMGAEGLTLCSGSLTGVLVRSVTSA
ncbi:hypothetical protein CKO36_05390 [Rhabdochromatium marinum]|nr:hypothetical protein [Rhabdochromatium marinum]